MDAGSEAPAWLVELAERSPMAARVAGFPWVATPLGPMERWPQSLRTAVRLCLSSRFPMGIVWGTELITIYNDDYRPFLGSEKQVGALGASYRDLWSEVWDDIGPMFDTVLETGSSTWNEHLPLFMDRNGFAEEAFFTFSTSPVHDDDGGVGGVLVTAMETTEEMVAKRRLALVGRLASALVSAADVIEISTAAVAALADMAAAQVWLRLGGRLVSVAGNDSTMTEHVTVERLDAISGESASVVLDQDWHPGRPARLAAVPIGDGPTVGVLVVSLNQAQPVDAGYLEFLDLVGRTISAAQENAYRRSEEVGRHRLVSETLQAAMLPPVSDLPNVAARYRPATSGLSVGGDWYEVVTVGPERRALLVGDCVGHGLAAATVMAQLRSVSRALLLEGRSPAQVLEAMDVFAADLDGAQCATVACAVVDTGRFEITYAAAGHPPPLLVRDGIGSWLNGGRGLPLGVVPRPRTDAVAPLLDEDVLVLYSDGLVERHGEGIDDGLERLRSAAEASVGLDVQSLADRLLTEVLEARRRDDVALLVKVVR